MTRKEIAIAVFEHIITKSELKEMTDMYNKVTNNNLTIEQFKDKMEQDGE